MRTLAELIIAIAILIAIIYPLAKRFLLVREEPDSEDMRMVWPEDLPAAGQSELASLPVDAPGMRVDSGGEPDGGSPYWPPDGPQAHQDDLDEPGEAETVAWFQELRSDEPNE